MAETENTAEATVLAEAENTAEATVLVAKASKASYTKAQLAESEKFSAQRDCLAAVLEDDKVYTAAEAEAAVEKFLKGKVK